MADAPTEPAPLDALAACSIDRWYPVLRRNSVRTTLVPLGDEFLAYLQADGVFVAGGDDDDDGWGDDDADGAAGTHSSCGCVELGDTRIWRSAAASRIVDGRADSFWTQPAAAGDGGRSPREMGVRGAKTRRSTTLYSRASSVSSASRPAASRPRVRSC